MKKLLILFSLFFFIQTVGQSQQGRYVLVIHGGAGTILRNQMSPERERAYNAALDTALRKGEAILARGGTALDAVEASVRYLEDCPLFNAGRGAVFTNEGRNELDAAIMDGRTLGAGAVAGVTVIRNPITAARAVMEKSEHVMMAGPGAEQFARKQGLEIVDPSYFYTEERWRGLLRARAEDSVKQLKGATDPLPAEQTRLALLHKELEDARTALAQASGSRADSLQRLVRQLSQNILKATFHDEKFGTVGAVALDRQGNLAAATSTGGMTNKKYGRIGDAPIIGAGTYANNQTVAISCTGWGEYFIRLGMAKTISDMMEFGKMNLQKAAGEMINHRLPALGGDGGLIAVDKNGNISLPFCTEGMYRGFVKEGEKRTVAIYKD